jgi:hypothetical protein
VGVGVGEEGEEEEKEVVGPGAVADGHLLARSANHGAGNAATAGFTRWVLRQTRNRNLI